MLRPDQAADVAEDESFFEPDELDELSADELLPDEALLDEDSDDEELSDDDFSLEPLEEDLEPRLSVL
jgi:hypothetical protein